MNKFLKIFFTIILVLLIALGLFIIPAHIQTRRIAPKLPSIEAVAQLRHETDGPARFSYVLTATQQTSKGALGHPVFIAQWEDGRIFMIDAGMDKQGAQDFSDLIKKISGGEDAQFFGTVTELLGPEVANVQGVGFTHLHIDHTQGIDNFCASRNQNLHADVNSYLTKLQQSQHNFNTKEGFKIITNSCLKDGFLKHSPITEIEEFPGIWIVNLGGHTPGSALYIIPIDGHLWILSGDIVATKSQFLNNHGKGFLYSYILVPENTRQTAKIRKWLAQLDALDFASVIVSHDLDALQASGLLMR